MKNRVILILMFLFCGTAHAGLQRALQLKLNDGVREYDLFVPDNTDNVKRPLVILYHGHMGDSDGMTGANDRYAPYKLWLKLAQRNNFIVAIPNGDKGADGYRGWNDCRADTSTNPRSDDVAFTLRMIEAINRQHPVDTRRIYATGSSNGGNMVIRLAMEVPQKFAAVAAVVASNPLKNKCKPQHQPISILFMNGTADPVLPYRGGPVGRQTAGRGEAMSTDDTLKYWREVDRTGPQPEVYDFPDTESHDESTVTRYIYKNVQQGTEVVLYKVKNGGHTEPSREEKYRWLYKRIVGNQNYDIEMAEEVWAFFQNKHR
jgi:polyhydroxybutyrate depolymerase